MRITNDKRDSILHSEVSKKFNDKIAKQEKKINEVLEKLVQKTVPKWVTEAMIESRFVSVKSNITFSGLPDFNNRKRSRFMDNISMYNLYACSGYSHHVKYEKTVKKEYEKLFTINETREKFKQELRILLRSFTTHKKLLEVFPNFEPYFKDVVDCKSLIPVEQIESFKKRWK